MQFKNLLTCNLDLLYCVFSVNQRNGQLICQILLMLSWTGLKVSSDGHGFVLSFCVVFKHILKLLLLNQLQFWVKKSLVIKMHISNSWLGPWIHGNKQEKFAVFAGYIVN